MDTLRNDLAPDTDPSMSREATAHDVFLLEEGLEMLERYRSIGDPQVRHVVRQLVATIADGQTREQ